jgi:hypothetical protein
MNKNNTEQQRPISIDAACRIAEHTAAILTDAETPKEFRHDLRLAVSELFNSTDGDSNKITDTFGYIRDCLLSAGGNADAIKEMHNLTATAAEKINDTTAELYSIAENAPHVVRRHLLDCIFEKTGVAVDFNADAPNIEDLSLPELLSKVLKHPDLPTKLYNVMTDELVENDVETDSPEWILGSLKKMEFNVRNG